MLNLFFRFFIFLIFSFMFLKAEQISDSFRLDGYGNINMSEGYPNADRLNLSGGFQGRYQITDNISVTGQVHFEEGQNSDGMTSNSLSDYKSELKWLYLDYYFKDDITLRVGAFQFPVFKSSETGDIGYTYTWTNTPLSFYGVFSCDDFEGVELLKNFSYKDFDFTAQLSFGKSNNELSDGRGDNRDGEVDNLVGLTLKTTHENFILNIGYITAKSTIETRRDFTDIDFNVDFDMFALESEIYLDKYTLKSGFIKTNLTNVFPEDMKYYTSLEYSYDDLTPYILYSKETLTFKNASANPSNNNPPNGNAPPDMKRLQETEQYLEKYSAGLRYDYNANIAFKVSYTHELSVREYNGFADDRTSNDILFGSINVIF